MQMPEIRMAAVRFLPEGCANLAGGAVLYRNPGRFRKMLLNFACF
jgi:hypothetical protein